MGASFCNMAILIYCITYRVNKWKCFDSSTKDCFHIPLLETVVKANETRREAGWHLELKKVTRCNQVGASLFAASASWLQWVQVIFSSLAAGTRFAAMEIFVITDFKAPVLWNAGRRVWWGIWQLVDLARSARQRGGRGETIRATIHNDSFYTCENAQVWRGWYSNLRVDFLPWLPNHPYAGGFKYNCMIYHQCKMV